MSASPTSIQRRLAALEARILVKPVVPPKLWICDVRQGHEAEDREAGFVAAGLEPDDGDIVRLVVHLPNQWTDGRQPIAMPREEYVSCRF